MLIYLLAVLGSCVGLYFGADWLVRGAAGLATRFGVSALVIGLTVVAYGTSMPELVVSLQANAAGQGGLAAGNVVGSNLFNIAVILGLAAVITPIRVRAQIIRVDVPLMLGATALVLIFLADMTLSRIEGAVLAAGIVVYSVGSIWFSRRKKETPEVTAEFEDGAPKPGRTLWVDFGWILLGLAALVVASRLLVYGGTGIARTFGVSEAIIGLTIVAAGTSLPELATSVVAALKKQPDIAVGNVVGSNLYNLLCILGLTSVFKPLSAEGILPLDLIFMTGVSVLLWPMTWSGRRVSRLEGGVLLCAYGSYLALRWPV